MRCWDWFGDRSLVVIDIALACCALEVEIAAEGLELSDLRADDPVVVVVSGTVTDTVLPLVRNIFDQVPGARVVSFGACASAGGPYWDSYAVTKGIEQIIDVDLFVPGCPPTPTALREALVSLRDSSAQQGSTPVGTGAPGVGA
ncbi:proton-conducting membrane transporter [Granulicoccus sp. GXG6511]|uniref:NADH-quinone oxidoreductase subunit B family protein n=1 Tax=Granulicoccus sp. GXG6511 TaxID=3381351 RepID=UPI003D7C65DF